MFKSILIANRGEIACRIIRTCRTLGIRSIAVYSDADRDALFVRQADEAIHIGPSEVRLSYLNSDAILAAAKSTAADAVHPGYGFLSENADFAEACDKAGITFIGPSASAIRQMGSKIKAKALALKIGVPVVPGYNGGDQTPDLLRKKAQEIGTPLLIKASAGGGGRGMRRVNDLADFDDALGAATKEAVSGFGDGTLLLEKYIERPRHIEVQLLCDNHGNAIHLHERDCSIQRNHQKVIEEAPAPDLPAETKDLLTTSALKLARAIDYTSTGTAEFIFDRDSGEVYFLEMNTRLQVEHPVTEMITGIDLVEQQIRIASGEELAFSQEDIQISGHAIEARIAAEDPAQAYLPQTGDILFCEEPGGTSVRVDSGITTGSSITPWYDSMLAKVIAYGQTREEATTGLLAALDNYHLAGVGHNLAFLHDIVDHPDFRRADVDTTFLSRSFPEGWRDDDVDEDILAIAGHTWLKSLDPAQSPWHSLGPWRLTGSAGLPGTSVVYLRRNDHEPVEVRLSGDTDTSSGTMHAGNVVSVSRGRARNVSFQVMRPEEVLLDRSALEAANDEPAVRAPMPGLISEIRCKVGDSIVAGDTAVVLEAMKLMQNLVAPVSGVVAAIHCSAGDTVVGKAVLLEIEAEE
jgi:acetyl-CoA carboxylase biotin carboxylase subunit